jgi:microcystin-dependent protein
VGLESGTFISDLVVTNPPTTDAKQQGDDHLRLIKTVLKNTFPTASKPIYFPDSTAKSANFSVLATEQYKIFLVDTTAGIVTATLPTLTGTDTGWECSFIKTNTGTNPILITPPSGTIQSGPISGLSRTRRCIPGVRSRVMWTGSAWIAERALGSPVGTIIEYAGTTLPVGYEWPNGQTLASASTNYPDYNAIRGSGTTPDRRGRTAAGKDDMGGGSANRLTGQTNGVNGDNFEATGGLETHALGGAQLPPHQHGGTTDTEGQSHTHTYNQAGTSALSATAGGGTPLSTLSAQQTGTQSANHTHTFTTDNGPGSSSPHNNIQPTIIENFLVVVE